MKSSRKSTLKCPECLRAYIPRKSAQRYCSRRCAWANNGGQNKKSETWWTNAKGYIEGRVTMPDGSQRRVKKHRWIMENYLGRMLHGDEIVHHINDDKLDNRIENLQVMRHSEHTKHHNEKRPHKGGYKLSLTKAERKARSNRAKSMKLSEMGRAAIAAKQTP